MKEKILEAFANLGFKLEDADGMGYVFDYEGIRFLYMYNENDENFLSKGIMKKNVKKYIHTHTHTHTHTHP